MDKKEFKTIVDVFNYTKPLVDQYRKFQSRKVEIATKLEIIFSPESDYLLIVVKDGRFAEAFVRKMGKGRMTSLKKLLYELNREYYQTIDFRID